MKLFFLLFATFIFSVANESCTAKNIRSSHLTDDTTHVQNTLSLLGWLEGGTWKAHQSLPNNSEGIDILMRCRWSETKTVLLMDLTSVRGGKPLPFMTAMFAWHPGKKKIAMWQVTQTGAVNEGEVTNVADGVVEQELQVTEPDGSTYFIKRKFDRTADNTFVFTSSVRKTTATDWKASPSLEFKREQ